MTLLLLIASLIISSEARNWVISSFINGKSMCLTTAYRYQKGSYGCYCDEWCSTVCVCITTDAFGQKWNLPCTTACLRWECVEGAFPQHCISDFRVEKNLVFADSADHKVNCLQWYWEGTKIRTDYFDGDPYYLDLCNRYGGQYDGLDIGGWNIDAKISKNGHQENAVMTGGSHDNIIGDSQRCGLSHWAHSYIYTMMYSNTQRYAHNALFVCNTPVSSTGYDSLLFPLVNMRHDAFWCTRAERSERYKLLWKNSYPPCDNEVTSGGCFTDLTVEAAFIQCDRYPNCIGFSWYGNAGCFKQYSNNCFGSFITGVPHDYYGRCTSIHIYGGFDYPTPFCNGQWQKLGEKEYPNCDNVDSSPSGSCFAGISDVLAKSECEANSQCIGYSWLNGDGCFKKYSINCANMVTGDYDYWGRCPISYYGSTVTLPSVPSAPSDPSPYFDNSFLMISIGVFVICCFAVYTLCLLIKINKYRYGEEDQRKAFK